MRKRKITFPGVVQAHSLSNENKIKCSCADCSNSSLSSSEKCGTFLISKLAKLFPASS